MSRQANLCARPYVGRRWLPLLVVSLIIPILMLDTRQSFSEPLHQDAPAGAAPASESAAVVAFPGAEGFGAKSVGGRGGRVIEVTNLDDSGPGSLRACVEAEGPRTCVFRVGGTITTYSDIRATSPYLTIAGQTAPGGGITLRASPDYYEEPITIRTHDVIIRHIRFRAGASTIPNSSRRSFRLDSGAYNVIIDHCSFSWATDQPLLLIDGVHDITVQWSVISEGLNASTHDEGGLIAHSKGFSVSGKSYHSTDRTGKITIHHNLLAHNGQRNPQNAGFDLEDVVNNVIYNWGEEGFHTSDMQTDVPSNVVNNYFKAGVNTTGYEIQATHTNNAVAGPRVYIRGNIGPHRTDDTQPDINLVKPSGRPYIVTNPFPAPPVTTTGAEQAYADVLAFVGARIPTLDAVDKRVIEEVRRGEGRIIDCVSARELSATIDCAARIHLTPADYTKYGINDPLDERGWPILAAGTPPQDSDHDGMPDAWESARGLNPGADDSAQDRNADGYTNLEEYLNELASSSFPSGTPPPVPTPVPTPLPTPTATATPIPIGTPPEPSGGEELVFVSSTSRGQIGGIVFADEDVLVYNMDTGMWAIYFDGSDVLPTAVDIDGLTQLGDSSLLLSFDAPVEISGLGLVDDSDIVRFSPSSVGANTAGSFSWYFDGSDVGLTTDAEDVDALGVLADGRLVISTLGTAGIPGLPRVMDEDLLLFQPVQLGETTSGSWAVYFDGSLVGLDAGSEDVNGVWIDPTNGRRELTTNGDFSVPGLSGDGADIFVCADGSLAPTTACGFTMHWDGSAYGFAGEIADAIDIGSDAQMVSGQRIIPGWAAAHDGAGDDLNADPNEGPDEVTDVDKQVVFLPLMSR